MKVSREKAAENRQHVVETAAKLFREKGFDGVGVSSLMQAAGMTHGGFYKQFTAKEELIAEAMGAAVAQSRARLAAAAPDDPARFAQIVRMYLSPAHRDAPGEGCALAALAAESGRHGAGLQAAAEAGVQDYLDGLTAVLGDPARAAAVLAQMVGALVLARAAGQGALSDQILAQNIAALLGE